MIPSEEIKHGQSHYRVSGQDTRSNNNNIKSSYFECLQLLSTLHRNVYITDRNVYNKMTFYQTVKHALSTK